MFSQGDLIIYSSRGVYRVEDRSIMDNGAGEKEYYTLCPVFGKGTVYIPVDSPVFMRPVMSPEEAHEVIKIYPDVEGQPFLIKNMAALKEKYNNVLQSHDAPQLIAMIKGIKKKTSTAINNGKQPAQIDKQFLEKAEDLLYGELACVLGLNRIEIMELIKKRK